MACRLKKRSYHPIWPFFLLFDVSAMRAARSAWAASLTPRLRSQAPLTTWPEGKLGLSEKKKKEKKVKT
jgi:hypothetical protein